MHKVAVLWFGWGNHSESYARCSSGLDEAARVFSTSLVYAVLNWWLLQAPWVLWRFKIKDHTSRLKLYVAKIQQKFTVLCVKIVVSRQWTIVEIPVGLLVFVKRVIINNYQKPGRLKTSTVEGSVKLVGEFLAQDRQATCEEISQAAGISPTSVFCILTNDFQKRKICAWWVPHRLTAKQKQKHLETATLLKQRFNFEGQAFLYRIVAIDKIWVTDFEPKLNSQSNERISPTAPWPKKFWWAQSKVT